MGRGWKRAVMAARATRTKALPKPILLVDYSVGPADVAAGIQRATWPIRVISEANVSTEHWAAKARRVKSMRSSACLFAQTSFTKPKLPVVVTLCRLAPARNRIRDSHENYPMCFKHVVDGIADWLGVNDGDRKSVRWEYAPEEKSPAFGVRVEVRSQ